MAELESTPKSIQSIYAWYAEQKLWVNRRYQRKLVWTLEEKQRLVESVLQRFPIPAILLSERTDGGYEVIDGLQRLHALMSFIEQAFPTEDGRWFAVKQFVTANTRAGDGIFALREEGPFLTPREVGTFLDYTLAVSVMRDATPRDVDEVFRRINTYGHRLSDQERRQAGVRNEFSVLVREIACSLRGDVSDVELELATMPSISIDMPKARHGYHVEASEVFWVSQGILRSTDLRDSMDEQCIADVVASVVGGALLPRSKDALDSVYDDGTAEADRIRDALAVYGAEKIAAEFKFVVDQIQCIAQAGVGNLRDLLFKTRNTNPFPALFTVLFIALHELLLVEGKQIADFAEASEALANLNSHVDTSRGSTSPEDRRKNVNIIKGLLAASVVPGERPDIYGDHTSFDVDEILRLSEIEAPHYELKQGIVELSTGKEVDSKVIPRVVQTMCAIANNGPDRGGTVLIGVADSDSDAKRVEDIHGVKGRRVGQRWVVGVKREANVLNESMEKYMARFREGIANSALSEPLKSSVLSSISYSNYYGLGVVLLRVPPQRDVSTVGDTVFVREGDKTVEAKGLELLNVQKRFT